MLSTKKKETKTTTADLKLTNIYTANGGTSNYKKIRAKVKDGKETVAYKGQYNTIPIPSSRQSKGKYVPLMGKGNNPKFDCRISGSWVVH